mmetsp:Transcript_53077/g.121895  ORF Transcript_53077/g.121895 Transcript_53077/m.121895 type:complete len:205 (+) Transcript_53077:49-663(+)
MRVLCGGVEVQRRQVGRRGEGEGEGDEAHWEPSGQRMHWRLALRSAGLSVERPRQLIMAIERASARRFLRRSVRCCFLTPRLSCRLYLSCSSASCCGFRRAAFAAFRFVSAPASRCCCAANKRPVLEVVLRPPGASSASLVSISSAAPPADSPATRGQAASPSPAPSASPPLPSLSPPPSIRGGAAFQSNSSAIWLTIDTDAAC